MGRLLLLLPAPLVASVKQLVQACCLFHCLPQLSFPLCVPVVAGCMQRSWSAFTTLVVGNVRISPRFFFAIKIWSVHSLYFSVILNFKARRSWEKYGFPKSSSPPAFSFSSCPPVQNNRHGICNCNSLPSFIMIRRLCLHT